METDKGEIARREREFDARLGFTAPSEPERLVLLTDVERLCRDVRTSGFAWLLVTVLAGVIFSGLGAYVVTALALLGAVYAHGLLVASIGIGRRCARLQLVKKED